MKNINLQVEFHFFVCLKKKRLFYTNSCEPGGVNCRPHYQNVPNAKSERAVREGRQRGPLERASREGRHFSKCEAAAKLLGLERCIQKYRAGTPTISN